MQLFFVTPILMLCYAVSEGIGGELDPGKRLSLSFTPLPNPCFQSETRLQWDTDFTHRGLEPATRGIANAPTSKTKLLQRFWWR